MNVALRPETERFIDEQVKAGRFTSREAMIETAIAELSDLDDAAVDAINEAEAQADRGEGMELDAFRAKMAARFRR